MKSGSLSASLESRPARRYDLAAIWQEGSAVSRLSRVGLGCQLCLQACRNVLAAPLTSLLTVLTLTVALFLFAAFVLIIQNLRQVVTTTQSEQSLSIYVRSQTSAAEIDQALKELQSLPEISEHHYVSPDEALRRFRRELGPDSALLEGLEERNPLPGSIEVRFAEGRARPETFQRLVNQYSDQSWVERVQYSRGVVGSLGVVLDFLRTAGSAAILVMLFLTAFIVTNTIKLAVYAHRNEIEIMRLVGASTAMIRAPFMIEGLGQGLVGGVLALGILYSVHQSLLETVSGLPVFGDLIPELQFLSFGNLSLVIISGIIVGLLGSFLALRHFSTD